jgi:predicted porin
LRPVDYDTLSANRDYAHYHYGVFFYNNFFKQLSTDGDFGFGTDTNYDPAAGPPVLANSSYAQLRVTVQPMGRLTIDNTYLLTRLRSQLTNLNIFNDHIIRSKWNYQFTREFSLRFIAQYSAVLANPQLTSLQTTKSFNADVLLTYLLHPGTAVYVGYNSNLQNLDRSLQLDPNGNLLRTQNRFLNDGRQVFVKISYLFRY